MALKKRKAAKKKVAKKKIIKKKALKRKPVKRASVKKGAKKKAPVIKKKRENVLGVITHYFPHVQAAVIKLKGALNVGESIKVKGHTTDFTQAVTSMQIDRVAITSAKKGDEIGLLVNSRVRQHDLVYKA